MIVKGPIDCRQAVEVKSNLSSGKTQKRSLTVSRTLSVASVQLGIDLRVQHNPVALTIYDDRPKPVRTHVTRFWD